MKNTLETRLGYLAALVVISTVVILEVLGGFNRLRGGYRIYGLFNNVQELKAGDPVKLAGVQIGTVAMLDITNIQSMDKVMVVLKIDSSRAVRTDSRATIKFAGLMGQNYVALDFGTPTAPLLKDGEIQTYEQADLGQLMSRLDSVAAGIENVTKTFSGDQLNNLLGPVTDFLKQNSEHLSGTISNVHNISGQIASGQGTVGRLIYTDTLHSTALAAITNIQEFASEGKLTLAEARKVVDEVNAGRGTLGKLSRDDKLYTEATASMTNLREILQKVNKGEGTVGKLINDDSFLKNAKLTLQKLDKATDGLEDQGPLSVMGNLATSLF